MYIEPPLDDALLELDFEASGVALLKVLGLLEDMESRVRVSFYL